MEELKKKTKEKAQAVVKKAFDWGVVLQGVIKSIASGNIASNVVRGILLLLTMGAYFFYERWKKKQAVEKTKKIQAEEQAQTAEETRSQADSSRRDSDSIDDEFGE